MRRRWPNSFRQQHTRCELCKAAGESLQHIFLESSFSLWLWTLLLDELQIWWDSP
ncbi:hypothetical protein Syun_016952 [Stephania yunnanensis]|uniref:Uncharacterized protein n=1 Tax=Stephania yunnanensis TaxID=152371 RepID=A0AAP0P4G0_9MAGN